MEQARNSGSEKTVEEIRHAISTLRLENELFHNYWNELEHKGLTGPVLNASPRRFTPQSSSRRRSRGRSSSSITQQLTIEQKNEIVQRAIDKAQAELAKGQFDNELVLENNKNEERSEVLHEVDLKQLQIKNQQCVVRIAELKRELLRLKVNASQKMETLTCVKEMLMTHLEESNNIDRDIISCQSVLQTMAAESKTIEEQEIQLVDEERTRLKTRLASYRVPTVMEYMQKKAQHNELKRTIAIWERKVEIKEVSLRNLHKMSKHETQYGRLPKLQSWQNVKQPEARI
uniref:cilia- and flagella-associated protein 263 n=1 Tax=Myxine glutinosa TaxID=7769 RepID=UPI00358E55A2